MSLYVFEINVPGTWLEGLSDETAHDVRSLLGHAQSCLADAALSLSLFEAALSERHQDGEGRSDRFGRNVERERLRQAELESELPHDLSHEERWERREELRHRATVEVRRDAWRDGELPDSYRHRLPFLHARSFVTALEGIRKTFEVMKSLPGIPESVADIVRGVDQDIPAMKHVRDSIHHGEDRVRGLRRGRQPIDLKPVDNGAVKAPGGVLIYDSLIDTRFGCTLADGEFGEVDVSPVTAARVAAAVQQVVEAFEWRGPREHVPS